MTEKSIAELEAEVAELQIQLTANRIWKKHCERLDPDLPEWKKGTIYIADSAHLTKIGWTVHPDPIPRLKTLAASNPYGMRLWAQVHGSQQRERAAHKFVAEFRQHGEWFALDALTRRKLAQWVRSHGGNVYRRPREII